MKKILTVLLTLALALSFTACGGTPDIAPKDVDLMGWYNELNSTTLTEENWPMQMPLEGEMLDSFYPGLSDIDTKVCVVTTAAISSAVGELALVEVEDAGDVQRVEEIFQARIDYQVGDENTPGGGFYPATIEGWEKDSQIVTQGNCVLLVAGEPSSDVVESFNALFA